MQSGLVDVVGIHSLLDFQVETFTHLGMVGGDGENRSVTRIQISIGIGL